MCILRGSAHILAFICTSNLTEESASPSVHGLSAIHVLTKISVKLPFQRAIAPQEHHHYTLDHKTLRVCFAAHPLYGTSIVTMPSPAMAAHEAIPCLASRFHPFCSWDLRHQPCKTNTRSPLSRRATIEPGGLSPPSAHSFRCHYPPF